jgi:hypothetical protein
MSEVRTLRRYPQPANRKAPRANRCLRPPAGRPLDLPALTPIYYLVRQDNPTNRNADHAVVQSGSHELWYEVHTCGCRRFISPERSRLPRSRFPQKRNHCRRITGGPPMLRQTTKPSSAPGAMIGSLPDISRAAFGTLRGACRAVVSRVRRTPISGQGTEDRL